MASSSVRDTNTPSATRFRAAGNELFCIGLYGLYELEFGYARAGAVIILAWSEQFREPIKLQNGLTFRTLRDAATYILKLSQVEQDTKEWQTALHCLIQASDFCGPVEFARLGVLRALHRHVERVFEPSYKNGFWGRQAGVGTMERESTSTARPKTKSITS
jgi:hypothetical protein